MFSYKKNIKLLNSCLYARPVGGTVTTGVDIDQLINNCIDTAKWNLAIENNGLSGALLQKVAYLSF